jgi:hypothetical protein
MRRHRKQELERKLPGDIRYVDVNGDGEISFDDRTDIGDPIPAATMGFNVAITNHLIFCIQFCICWE